MEQHSNVKDPSMRLLTELRQDLVAPPTDAKHRMRHRVLNTTMHSGSNPTVGRDNSMRRTLTGRPMLIVNAAVAVAITGTVAAFVVPGAISAGDTQSPADSTVAVAPPVNLRDVAYVKAQTTQALADVSNYVIKTHSVTINGLSRDDWREPSTGRTRMNAFNADGTPSYSSAFNPPSKVIEVRHADGTWQKYTDGPTPQALAPAPGMIGSDDPAPIRAALESGRFNLVGPETVDGHDTVHLKLSAEAGFLMDLWVDASTFLPFRSEVTKGLVAGPVSEQNEWTWLDKSPANLALLDLTPPAGYNEVH
jgi:hypothetical protein